MYVLNYGYVYSECYSKYQTIIKSRSVDANVT